MITAEHARELLDYNPETGSFYWRVAVNSSRPAGSPAGRINAQGYHKIKIAKKEYAAHRLAWLCVYGSFPSHDLDHINCDKRDNRISNLRLATNSENRANSRRSSNNKSGFKGVVASGRGWKAIITKNGRSIHIGQFNTPEQAHAAYRIAAAGIHGEFARSA